MKRALTLALLFIAVAAFAQTKRAFTIEDLYRAKGIADLSLSPDGRAVLFTVTSSDLPHGKRTTQVWITEADGAHAHAITGGTSDISPRYSPDGRQLLFIRENNLFLLPLGGGEAHQLTSISTGVSDRSGRPTGSGSHSPPTSIPSAAPTTPATRRSPTGGRRES